ncbi:MAG: hypothetical protein WDO70_11795 [Alphaproteobacteria bacterium]
MAAFHNLSSIFGGLFKSEPSPQVRMIHTVVWIAAYLVIFYVFRSVLPEKFFRDAEGLAQMIQTQKIDANAFGSMVIFYNAMPSWLVPHLPAIVGTLSLAVVLPYIRSYWIMLLMPFLFYPFVVFNFMAPSKETLVGIMALIVYRLCRNPHWEIPAFVGIVLMYALYGALVRPYYLLILVLFMGFIFMARTPVAIWLPCVLFVLVGMIFLPKEVFWEIQSSRDMYALSQSQAAGGHVVRTYFYNLLPPINVLNFFINTVWGVLVLVCPFLVAFTINELVMMLNVALYASAALAGFSKMQGAARLPYVLFMAHILTLAQFEPDLGSYLRHFSSVLVLIAPGFQFLFRVNQKQPAQAQAAAALS